MFTTINDCEIYYEVHGKDDGKAIFFIHGAPGLGDCRADLHAFKSLGDQYKLVFLDMRGSGRSEDKPPYSHEQWTADIDELRKQLNLDKIMIHGGSYGGFLSLEYVLRYQDHVSHVLLRDTAANQDYHHLSTERALKANLPSVTEEVLDRLWKGETTSDEDLKEIFGALLPLYTVEQNPDQIQDRIDSIFYHYETHNYAFKVNQPNYNIQDQLKSINVPVLVSVGRHDWVTPVECSETIAKELTNSTLIIYENSGHSPHVEENEKYLENVRQFINGTSKEEVTQ
ncbi:proline iminopeptidase [Bacillus mesophilus]|uniref:Alpha/beta hydrolase n=1 Tax=Bacillus mesophilus TaxID=1808955 RepID=A0A6M0QA72_9BACI|nr:alpha/beta hydrolase [Bacillus mesophilus]MBM7662014.1 proline iminopeptidase [Bacillus mesophilus]NEY72629.1 alpha/beta hydrolase [Bacillus mesophilus]